MIEFETIFLFITILVFIFCIVFLYLSRYSSDIEKREEYRVAAIVLGCVGILLIVVMYYILSVIEQGIRNQRNQISQNISIQPVRRRYLGETVSAAAD